MSVLWKVERLMSDKVLHVGTFLWMMLCGRPLETGSFFSPLAHTSRALGVLTPLRRWRSLSWASDVQEIPSHLWNNIWECISIRFAWYPCPDVQPVFWEDSRWIMAERVTWCQTAWFQVSHRLKINTIFKIGERPHCVTFQNDRLGWLGKEDMYLKFDWPHMFIDNTFYSYKKQVQLRYSGSESLPAQLFVYHVFLLTEAHQFVHFMHIITCHFLAESPAVNSSR